MTIDRAFVSYPLGHGQTVSIPHQVYPATFNQYVSYTNPYRLTLAGLGFLDLPAGIDVWTPSGYVAIASLAGQTIEFAPQFQTWVLENGVYVSTNTQVAQIHRSLVQDLEQLTGQYLSALPLYQGTFIQLKPLTQSHVEVTTVFDFEEAPGVPLSLTFIGESPVESPDDVPDPLEEYQFLFETSGSSVYNTAEYLIFEMTQALSLGSATILYDQDGDPVQISGSYQGNPYVVTYTYGTFNSIKQISYTTSVYKGRTFQNVNGFDSNGAQISSTGWVLL